MQTRLLACTSGGLFGFVIASPLSRELSLDPMFALLACSSVGVAVGYVVSVLCDVFATTGKQPD